MLLINLDSTDPFFNLAVDEYLLKERKENFFILGSNTQSVIIGKHQVAHKESDTKFAHDNGIPVLRRISGGGTVYHDPGNLNFSFILQSTPGRQVDFRKYTRPVIDFLSTVGVIASFEEKNDLKVNGLKISGNAEHVHRDRVLHHGTLLFDADLEKLKSSIRKDKSCYETKGVESNPSSVMNLRNSLSLNRTIDDFRNEMFSYFLGQTGNKQTELSGEDIKTVRKLAESKYSTWEWNYAYGPDYQFNKIFYLSGKSCSCQLSIKKGLITECILEGSPELTESGKKLVGYRHMPDDLKEFFLNHNPAKLGVDIYSFF